VKVAQRGDEQRLSLRTTPRKKSGCEGPGCSCCTPIVDDDAEPGPGQLRANAFLDRVRVAVAAAIDQELADIGFSSRDCPYLDPTIDRYRGRPGAELVAVVHRLAPSAGASSQSLIDAVRDRVVDGARRYRTLAGESRPLNVAAKAVGGGRSTELPPVPVRREGAAVESGLRGRLEHAFGISLAYVRVHDDAEASALTASVGARAVTIGRDVLMSPAERARPALEREVLLAHEVAHAVQQRDGQAAQPEPASLSAERDADRSAALVAAQLLLGPLPQGQAAPRHRSGLALGGCAAAAAPAIGAVVEGAAVGGAAAGGAAAGGLSISSVLGALGLGTIAVTLESDTPRTAEETCETAFPNVRECWTLPDEYVFPGASAALESMKLATGDDSLALHNPSPTTSGPCPGQGTHYNVRSGSSRAGSITCCPCCSDDLIGPVITEKCRIVW